MILAACATEFEMQAFLDQLNPEMKDYISLVTGVGVVETTLCLTRFLEQHQEQVDRVIHFGVGGAYISTATENIGLLAICLAEQEIFGDSGICYPDRIEPLSEQLLHKNTYVLDREMLAEAKTILGENGQNYSVGTFVTVCGVSATAKRGTMLAKQYAAICENMEGAAMARVCDEFQVPLLEIRAISNFVEDRDLSRWKMADACICAGTIAAQLLDGFKQF